MPHRVKLALVTETFPPEINGVAMTFGVIARELGRRGHQVTVYHPRRPQPSRAGVPAAYTEVSLPGFPLPGYPLLRLGLPAGRTLRRSWRAEPPDLVHVVTEGPLGASAISAARALGIPVSSSFHTNFHAYARHYGVGPMRRVVLAWLRHVHNRTCRTFAPTIDLCGELADAGFRNLAILSRGVDTHTFTPARRSALLRRQWGAEPDDPVVIHAGRMAAEKNYELLLHTYTTMRAVNPRCRFVLVGDGPLEPRLRRELPGAIFTGFIHERATIAAHYASADIYIHPSLTETFGNVLTEAMACGLAAAGFDYAAARMFIRHGRNGLVAPCEQPQALVDAAGMLADDGLLRAQLRTAARTTMEAQSWESVIARFEADLHGCVAAGTRDAPGKPPALKRATGSALAK